MGSLLILLILVVGTVGVASMSSKVKVIPGVSHAGIERLSGGKGLAILMSRFWGMPDTPLRVGGKRYLESRSA